MRKGDWIIAIVLILILSGQIMSYLREYPTINTTSEGTIVNKEAYSQLRNRDMSYRKHVIIIKDKNGDLISIDDLDLYVNLKVGNKISYKIEYQKGVKNSIKIDKHSIKEK